MTGDPRMFTSLDEEVDGQEKITFGDNSKGKVKGLGKVAISNDHSISNVLYVASLSFNLLSVGQLCDLGFQCLFTKKEVVVSTFLNIFSEKNVSPSAMSSPQETLV